MHIIVLNKLNSTNSMAQIITSHCTILLIRLVLQLLNEGKNSMMVVHDDYYFVLEILIYTLILIIWHTFWGDQRTEKQAHKTSSTNMPRKQVQTTSLIAQQWPR